MTEGGVGGNDTDGAGSDDGTDGEGGNPPQAAVVNAAISSIPILVSFKFAARFLNQHNYMKCARRGYKPRLHRWSSANRTCERPRSWMHGSRPV